ncbi:MAG: methyltransferase, partial [Chlamydiota bacterium]|nr:methyltransferase [Chlamydiota bacterium]
MRSQIPIFFKRQWIHAFFLVFLMAGLIFVTGIEGMHVGSFFSLSTTIWFWSAVIVAILHQVYVLICWRLQLHGSWLSRLLGDFAFKVYATGFAILGISRVLLVVLLALSNRGSLVGDQMIYRMLALIAILPALYLFYSVKRFFGFKRALGIDHFDARYRTMEFVRKGIFRYTRNGMYTYGFLLLWAIAFWYGSMAALCAAAFNHMYIWIHYYTT